MFLRGLILGFHKASLIPITSCVAWNVLARGKISSLFSEIYSHILSPLAPAWSSHMLANSLRNTSKLLGLKNIDISGHVIIQAASNIYVMHTLQSLADCDHAIQELALSILAGAYSITDAIFMYHTSTYCHSNVEVATGVALTAFSYLVGLKSSWGITAVVSLLLDLGMRIIESNRYRPTKKPHTTKAL